MALCRRFLHFLLSVACVLLPENVALATAAFSALPSVDAAAPPLVAGPVSALDFVCALWSHLYHQLQRLAGERDSKEAAQAAASVAELKVDPSAEVEMSIDEQRADPFAAAAAVAAGRSRVGGDGAAVAAPSSAIEAQLVEAANGSADDEFEAMVSPSCTHLQQVDVPALDQL